VKQEKNYYFVLFCILSLLILLVPISQYYIDTQKQKQKIEAYQNVFNKMATSNASKVWLNNHESVHIVNHHANYTYDRYMNADECVGISQNENGKQYTIFNKEETYGYGKVYSGDPEPLYYVSVKSTENIEQSFKKEQNNFADLLWDSTIEKVIMIEDIEEGGHIIVTETIASDGNVGNIIYTVNRNYEISHYESQVPGYEYTADITYDEWIDEDIALEIQDIYTKSHLNEKSLTLINIDTGYEETKTTCKDGMFYLYIESALNYAYYYDKDATKAVTEEDLYNDFSKDHICYYVKTL